MYSGRTFVVALVMTLLVTGCQSSSRELSRATGAASAFNPAPLEDYRLGTGDIVSVRVYGGEEDLRLERVRLDSAGMIVLPFGTYEALGRTTREIEDAIMKTASGRLLKNPRVSVYIDEYRPFFVDGQVGRPGAYPYQPGLTVRKAVTIAGGFRERASLQKIFLMRERDATYTPIRVDLNAPVRPGDTIMVEESLF